MHELTERYLENLIDEPVVVAHAHPVGETGWLNHTDPVSETAINAALQAGRNQVLETLMSYEPENLEEEDDSTRKDH